MARKEWELLFNLSAKQNSNFSSTFKAAQSALVETQNRIQQLNKAVSYTHLIPSRAAPKPCASTQTLMWPMQRRKPGRTISVSYTHLFLCW